MRIDVKSLSFSTYSQYLGCPESVWYSKIKREKPVGVAAALAFGTAIHAAAECFYRHLKVFQKPLPVKMLERVFKQTYETNPESDLIYGAQTKDDLFKTASQLLILLADETLPGTVVAVEDPRVLDLDALKIILRMDLITRDEDNVLVLWDLKTAKNRYGDDEKAKVTEQLALYSLAFEEPVRLRVKVLQKTRQPLIENIDLPYTPDSGPEVVEQICQVKEAIEKGVHYKIRSFRCQTCGYRHLCQPKGDPSD